MTHPMIEKLAAIIDPAAFMPSSVHKSDGRVFAFAIGRAREKAIAVLRALREPDEVMAYCGGAKIFQPGQSFEKCAADSFTAMLDSILPEEKEQP